MTKLSGKKVLITGASSGIGRAMAITLADKGAELFLVARREDKLLELASILNHTKVTIIPIDINEQALNQKIIEVTGKKIDILINNAGLALGKDKVCDSKFEDWNQMIQTNVIANFKLVHLVLPWMLESGGGDIINVCSIAGHYTYQGGAVYCATKHAVHAFTRAVREETAGRNVRVMQISPGMVNTEFSTVRLKGNTKSADEVYAGMTPLVSEDIARMMLFMLEQPRHVVIDEIITMPMDQGSLATVHRDLKG